MLGPWSCSVAFAVYFLYFLPLAFPASTISKEVKMGRARAIPRGAEKGGFSARETPGWRWSRFAARGGLKLRFPTGALQTKQQGQCQARSTTPYQPQEHPPLEGTASLEEGGEDCGAIRAVTQKGCGFPNMSFESLRDLGCVCPWLPPLGLACPQNRLAQGVG